MNTLTKGIIAAVAALIIGGAIYGAYQYPKQQFIASSPVGSTFGDAKIASVNMTPATSGATSTSILNTDGSARWVANYGMTACTGAGSSFTFLTGAGIANLLLQAATTSVPNQGLQGNTNYALNLQVATTTAFSNSASSTSPVLGGYWPANTYLTFTFNATNTAACTVEIDYLAS